MASGSCGLSSVHGQPVLSGGGGGSSLRGGQRMVTSVGQSYMQFLQRYCRRAYFAHHNARSGVGQPCGLLQSSASGQGQ